MAQTIKLKRSGTSGAAPTTSQLELGEVAINTYDGKMYIKKSVSGTESIVEVGGLSSVSLGGISDVTISSAVADQLLQYNGSEWVNVSIAEASAIMKEYQFTATSGQSTFSGSDDNSETLSYTAGAIQVFLNGIFLDSAVDYTATNGTSIVLSETVDANDYLQVVAFKKKIGDGNVSVDTFTGDDSTTAFTLSVDPGDENNTRVFIDGVYQSKDNYSVSGTTLTFSTAPPTSTAIEVEIGNRVVTLDTLSDLDLPDDVKLRLGTDQDLQIYHDGSNSYIDENGTGELRLRSNEVELRDMSNNVLAKFSSGGANNLYYANSEKLATTNDGISVTGDVEADEFIGDVRGAVLFKAQAGETLAKGDVVYISGISGNTTIVSKADADDASKMPAFGLVAAAASSGNPVDIYTNGILSGIDTSSYSEGDELFVSTTAGGLTATPPTGESAALQKIGKVTRSASSGSIFIVGAGRSNAVPNLDDGDIFIGNSSNQAVSASLNTKIESYLDGGTSTPTFAGLATTANMTFGDNDKAIFGAGSDLQIYHDASHSFIKDSGTGHLKIQATNLKLQDVDGNNYIDCIDGSYVRLMHNTATKLETTSTGIDVTGNVVSDGLTVNGVAKITSAAPKLTFVESDTTDLNTRLRIAGGSFQYHTANDAEDTFTRRLQIDNSTGDISFYEDTGTTAKFRWDASAERLGLGVTNPGRTLEVSTDGTAQFRLSRVDTTINGNNTIGTIEFWGNDDTSGTIGATIVAHAASTWGGGAYPTDLRFSTMAGSTLSERMRIDHDGNVGIGTSSPAQTLHVSSTGATSNGIRISNSEGSFDARVDQGEFYLYDVDDSRIPFLIDTSGNVGIGTSSPSTTLDVEGNITLSGSNGKIYLPQSPNNFNWIGDPIEQTGIVIIPTNDDSSERITFAVDNSEVMRIDSSGNVGIGTSSPNSIVDIRENATGGQARLRLFNTDQTNSTAQSALLFMSPDLRANGVEIEAVKENADFSAAAGRDIAIAFKPVLNNAATERMRIDASGNVGIGTTSPDAKLVVSEGGTTAAHGDTDLLVRHSSAAGSTAQVQILAGNTASSNLYFSDTDAYAVGGFQYNHSSNYLATRVNNSERMRIDSSGALGLGTTPPSTNSHPQMFIGTESVILGSSSGALDIGNNLYYNSGWKYRTTGAAALQDFDASGNIVFYRASSGTANAAVTLNESMRIGSSGLVTVKGSGAGSVSDHFRIESSDTESKLAFVNTTGNGAITQTGGAMRFMTNTANIERMRLDASGVLYIGSGHLTNAPSDGVIAAAYADGYNNAGGDLEFYGGRSTGDNAGGEIKFFTGAAGSPGTQINSHTRRMTINADGNVGIGSTSPATKLEVAGTTPVIRLTDSRLLDNPNWDNVSLGSVQFYTSDTSSPGARVGAEIEAFADGDSASAPNFNLLFKTATNTGTATEKLRIDKDGRVGIGTTSPVQALDVVGSIQTDTAFRAYDSVGGAYRNVLRYDSGNVRLETGTGSTARELGIWTAGTERIRVDTSGNVGIGTTSPSAPLHIDAAGMGDVYSGLVQNSTTDTDHYNVIRFMQGASGSATGMIGTGGSATSNLAFRNTFVIGTQSSNDFVLVSNDTERMRINSAGNVGIGVSSIPSWANLITNGTVAVGGVLYIKQDQKIQGLTAFPGGAGSLVLNPDGGSVLVGKTSTNIATAGCRFGNFGAILTRGDGSEPLRVNRTSSDGEIIKLDKDGLSVGSIGTASSRIYIGTSDTGLGFSAPSDAVFPVDASDGSQRDNVIDLGIDTARFDDIYATNGTIQTSDRNEKQDIEALSDAEQRVAVAAKGLLRKFRWIDSVEEKGDEARIHFGIIAQDLQDAFTAEGLDAGRYAMFISTTWTDEDTSEERTRMGVRYSELLAFIIAAI